MADRLHIITAAPRAVTLDGRDYRVSPFGPREYGELRRYLADTTPDPRTVARQHMEGLPEAVQIAIWDRALAESKNWPPKLEDPNAIQRVFLETDGQALLVYLALRKTTPGLSREAAAELAERLSDDELYEVWRLVTPEPPALPKEKAETDPSTGI